ncbi:hypothetical protein [Oceanobacillus polygoni]|uniref:Uncharacterized protein n=1 Tax=Oceanobacillus polygoni TaxID=1235259 RepID=A0A9X0Z0Z4_9BACI|nr:hypothetical protein [Oceanobacillus polygoni]MBP2079649.1 hypothetical protein [Oceanobacillus polygoni]
MKHIELANIRNLAKLEDDLNALGKGNDYSAVEDEAVELARIPENLESGLINVRKDYEKDSIVCIFHIIELEGNEDEENQVLIDLSYTNTNHYS